MFRRLTACMIAIIVVATMPISALTHDYKTALAELADDDIRDLAQSSNVINAIRAQNKTSASLTQGAISALDKQWRNEISSGKFDLIDDVMSNELSIYLMNIMNQSHGVYNEIIVMDMKGLNVGVSAITTDYWQGDEAKWLKTYGAGPEGILIDDLQFDESTQTYQSQVSLTIVDPYDNSAIGAITVGVNVELLE